MDQFAHLRRFACLDKFNISFENAIMFVGKLLDDTNGNVFGKTLYIPATDKHPALTFKITRMPFTGPNSLNSFGIQFNSIEERQLIADYDFNGDTFYIEV